MNIEPSSCRPGYGLSVNWTPAPCNRSEARMRSDETAKELFLRPRLFTNGWHLCADVRDDDVRMPLITLAENDMVDFMDQITNYPDWNTKLDTFAETWRKEQKGEIPGWTWSFSVETLEYVIQELRYKAKVFNDTGLIALYHGDVVKSDVVIPIELKESLKGAAAELGEEVLATKKKERKGLIDIVNPNRSTVSFGSTRVIVDSVLDRETCLQQMRGGYKLSDKSDFQTPLGFYWKQYLVANPSAADPGRARQLEEYRTYGNAQWLPCDVDISGDTPRISSYINNLHPREYAPLYTILEEILDKVIPAWNMSLTPLRTFRYKKRINFRGPDYGDLKKWVEENGPKLEDFKDEKYPERAHRDAKRELYISKALEFLQMPQVSEEFKEPDPSLPIVDLKADYKDRGLQVVVRFRDIYLTPEEPMLSDGPNYHIEGIPNDHICAVANYYYDLENVGTARRLIFAHPEKVQPAFNRNKLWSDYDHQWLKTIFGFNNKKSSIKNAGAMNVLEGRLVTFPNLVFYAHNRFKLVDQAKNGHCKILTLLLVDPNIRVISSDIVPCQQYGWWVKEVTADGGPLQALPYELRLEVVKYIREWRLDGIGYAKTYHEEQRLFRKRHVLEGRYFGFRDNDHRFMFSDTTSDGGENEDEDEDEDED